MDSSTVSAFERGAERLAHLATSRLRGLQQLPTIASPQGLENAVRKLPRQLDEQGCGLEGAMQLILSDLAPALAEGHAGPRYFGFVTGGVLPEATLADWVVTLMDQNVQVHLARETLSTYVDRLAVKMTLELLGLSPQLWTGTITTGATGSNILGLASARESVLRQFGCSPSEDGLADCRPVNVFVALPHASVKKAASLVGIGRSRVQECGITVNSGSPSDRVLALDFDLDSLKLHLETAAKNREGSIVVAGFGEVNTGALTAQLPQLRALCDQYGAWLHVDAAFSAFAALLPEFQWIPDHLMLADSIASDAHKQLNVPYDAGLFFIKAQKKGSSVSSELERVLGPGAGPAPAYLAGPSSSKFGKDSDAEEIWAEIASMPSPLNINLENSRRFRALPLYASLISKGRSGYAEIVERNVAFARRVERWMRREGSQMYEVLTPECKPAQHDQAVPWTGRWGTTILLFRANHATCPMSAYKDPKDGHLALTQAIKARRKMYVTSTAFAGLGAIRMAVSNWMTGDADYDIVIDELTQVMSV